MFVIRSIVIHDRFDSMELQQLRYVLAVAETRSFTRAAAKCFVVQSALSHQIRALERELGFPLFARTSRRVDVTAAGEAFLSGARDCLEAAERAVVEAAAATGRVQGRLVIGVIPTVTAVDVPAAISRFRSAHPDVGVSVRGGASTQFIETIREGGMDVAFLGLPSNQPPNGVAHQELKRGRLLAVVAGSHRLAGRRRLRLTDLTDEPFADFPAGSPGRAQSDGGFVAAGVHREVAFEAMSVELMLDLIRAGLAVALLPAGVVPQGSGLVTIPVTDGPERVEYLAWSGFNPSPAARAFLEVLGEDHPGQV